MHFAPTFRKIQGTATRSGKYRKTVATLLTSARILEKRFHIVEDPYDLHLHARMPSNAPHADISPHPGSLRAQQNKTQGERLSYEARDFRRTRTTRSGNRRHWTGYLLVTKPYYA